MAASEPSAETRWPWRTPRKVSFVCIRDRRVVRAECGPRLCPDCREPMEQMHYSYRVPKRNDDKAWRRMASGDMFTESHPRRHSLNRGVKPKGAKRGTWSRWWSHD